MGSDDLSVLIRTFSRGGYGTLAGAISGLLFALATFLPSFIDIPRFLETGAVCDSVDSCDDLAGWVIMVAIAAIGLGAVLGALFAILGKRSATRVLGPEQERLGQVVGGLFGGVLPWLTLMILASLL
jgi:hypothetical protein